MSTEKFWYPSSKETIFTSPDNGGALVKLTLTWAKAFDDVTNNDLLLLICCHAAQTFQIPPRRCNDAYGGWCGYPSTSLPKKVVAEPAPAANTTTNTTTRLLVEDNATNATNVTAVVQTEWIANIYI